MTPAAAPVPRMRSVLAWARRLGVPVDLLRDELEGGGKPLYRMGSRLLAREEDVVALLDKLRAATRAEQDTRVDIAMELEMRRMGARPRRAPKRTGVA